MKKQTPSKPFFERFLEKQELSEVKAGRGYVTLKYPSDDDEEGETS